MGQVASQLSNNDFIPANVLDHAKFAEYVNANPHTGHLALHDAEFFTMGLFLSLCVEMEREPSDFARLHPSDWQPFIPSVSARAFLGGGV